jgi:hypothetical protein
MQMTIPRIIVAVLMVLLIGSCGSELPPQSPSMLTIQSQSKVSVSTTVAHYEKYQDVRLVISNTSQTDIFLLPTEGSIGEDKTPLRFYQITPQGWKPLTPKPSEYFADSYEPTVIQAGSEIESVIGGALLTVSSGYRRPGTYLARAEYRTTNTPNDPEIWQYSNEFQVTVFKESVQETGLEFEFDVTVHIDQTALPNFLVANKWTNSIWIAPMCTTAHIEAEGTRYTDDGYTNLQKLTDVGWIAVPIPKQICTGKLEPIKVDPGQSVYIDATQWYSTEPKQLDSGIYRWDVVHYLHKHPPVDTIWLSDPRHIYTSSFEYVSLAP